MWQEGEDRAKGLLHGTLMRFGVLILFIIIDWEWLKYLRAARYIVLIVIWYFYILSETMSTKVF